MADELTRPLGLAPPRQKRGFLLPAAIAGGVLLAGAAIAGVVLLALPNRTGPTATATIGAPAPPSATDITGATKRPQAPPPPAAGLTEVKPDGGLTDIGKVVIHVPGDAPVVQLASAPTPALIEKGRYGPLPKIGSDGTRPLDAYARPVDGSLRDTRVAIVIGGVGIDPAGTAQAIALPGPVTLAMAPYGNGIAGTMADARAGGHELLLQIPLEPFNYPKTDPGPRTLTVEAPASENLDRLAWLMSRTTNYVGVVNYMGARFTGEAAALSPVLAEIGKRGLLYLDDGSSARSRAMDVAGRAPVLRADVVLDADLSAAAIDERLNQLRSIARQRGYAIASATAFPLTIERVAEFARTAAERGFVIVPVSALAAGGRS
jgi:polysaccharide deacetylase 2 family uncharacterized protein YibQ